MPSPRNVIAVCGPTATGKSKLAIELALALRARFHGGQVINADALQIYKALPLLTAKVTLDETKGVPHHLMSFLDPLEDDDYHMLVFRRDAFRVMQQVHDEGQVPIVTGGTAYYVQHLFIPPAPLASPGGGIVSDNLSTEQRSLLDLLPTLPSISSSSEFPPGFPIEVLPIKEQTAEAFAWELWTILDVLAPERAAKWHWKDVRKVRRQLEVLLGPAEQEAVSTPDYRVLLFWLHCERETLIARLDRRVDQMVEDGLVDEVQQLFEAQKARGKPIDYSKGIYQAIGYRPISERLGGPQDAKGLAEAIERTKVQTRQFAKKQTSWFRQKLWPAVQESERVELFVLDTSDVAAFDVEVVKPACAIAEDFLSGRALPDPLEICPAAIELLVPAEKSQEEQHHIKCDICTEDLNRPFMVLSGAPHEKHLRSKDHRARLRHREARPAA